MLHVCRGIPLLRPHETFLFISHPISKIEYIFICNNIHVRYIAAPSGLNVRISCRTIFHRFEYYYGEWNDRDQLYYYGPNIARDIDHLQHRVGYPLEQALTDRLFLVKQEYHSVEWTSRPINSMVHRYEKMYLTRAEDL